MKLHLFLVLPALLLPWRGAFAHGGNGQIDTRPLAMAIASLATAIQAEMSADTGGGGGGAGAGAAAPVNSEPSASPAPLDTTDANTPPAEPLLSEGDFSSGPSAAPAEEEQPASSARKFQVWATAEGLIGGKTALGTRIGKWSEGAALPSRKALRRPVAVTYLANGRQSTCDVLDVGPWNTRDPYWEREDGRPQAESGRDLFGRRTNKAGIDLFNATWYKLLALRAYDRRLIENTSGEVEWSFAD